MIYFPLKPKISDNSVAEHLDFMNTVDTSEMTFNQFRQTQHDYIGYQSLTDVPRACIYTEEISTDLLVSIEAYELFMLKKI